MFERDAQTVVVRNKPQQVAMDAATQMVSHRGLCVYLASLLFFFLIQNKDGCFINVRGDRVLPIKGVYETADEYHQRILEKVGQAQLTENSNTSPNSLFS